MLPCQPARADGTACKSLEKYGDQSCNEVMLGAEIWSYNRLYPLLDGLFQDLAATQIAILSLNPNQANGTQLDAINQSFQMQLGFNQMSALQNQSVAQMMTANTALQSSLVQQQGTILQQQLTAQRQLEDATAKQAKDTSAKANADILAADQQAVNQAQSNLSSLSSQMSLITSQLKAPTFTPTFPTQAMASSTNLPAGSQLPTSLPSAAVTPSNASAPNFPSTKQMDNQVQLLWERLSTLMSGMMKPDSGQPTDDLYLLQINTGIFPIKRKQQLLQTDYILSCKDNNLTPTVLDMFPRMAAVNITNTKYRDTSAGFGTALAWLGFGVNAAYNREHLRVSQLLGQSSYITGYGVGQNEFGWKFGIPLGDDQIPPDTRNTFVLITVPKNCGTPIVTLKDTIWSDMNGRIKERQDDQSAIQGKFNNLATQLWSNVLLLGKGDNNTQLVRSISFNRAEYDSAPGGSPSSASVSMTITLTQALDQQQVVTANGILIRRARDTFARAVTASGNVGSGGLLEANQIASNTWIPLSARTFLLNLDGTAFGQRFPTIVLSSPSGVYNLTANMGEHCPDELSVSGRKIITAGLQNCSNLLPSLAYKKPNPRALSIVRSIESSADGPWGYVIFTAGDAPAGSSATMSSLSSVQILSQSGTAQWGTNTEVYELYDSGAERRLVCDPPGGSRLICEIPNADFDTKKFRLLGSSYQVIDLNHIIDGSNNTGSVQSFVNIPACYFNKSYNTCNVPTFWDTEGPTLTGGEWVFKVRFVNVDLDNQPTAKLKENDKLGDWTCEGSSRRCAVTFSIKADEIPTYKDRMTIILHPQRGPDQLVVVTNLLTNIQPTVSSSIDLTNFSGANLSDRFTALRIGTTGKTHEITCVQNINCQLKDPKGLANESKGGLVYLVSGERNVQLVQRAANGSPSIVSYTPSALKPKTSTKTQVASGESAASAAISAPTSATTNGTKSNLDTKGTVQSVLESIQSTSPVSGSQQVKQPAASPTQPTSAPSQPEPTPKP